MPPIVAPPTPSGPSLRRALAVAVATRLVGVTNATGYLGQLGAKNGLPGVVGTPKDPPPKSADDPRVQPYFIVFPGIGSVGPELALNDLQPGDVDIDSLFRITAAAGDVQDLLALIDRLDTRLYRWSPGVFTQPDGTPVVCGPLRPPPGFDPQLLIDQQFTPARHYTSLQYVLHANT